MSYVTAVLVGLASLAVTSPVALVTAAWVGGGAIAVGVRDSAWTYAVAGVLIATTACLVVTAWATIPGIVRGRPRPAVTALVVLLLLLALSSSRAWPTVVASWLPRPIAIGLLGLAVIALIVTLVRRPARGAAVVGVAPAVAGVVGAYIVVAAVVSLPGQGIPQFPRPLWVPAFEGDARSALPVEAAPTPRNPAMAAGEWANIHNDTWMTDAYAQARLPDPETAEVVSFFAGGDCASLLWNDVGEIIAVCVSPTEVRGYILDPRTLLPRAERRISQRPLAADALTNFSGGGYAVPAAWRRHRSL